MNVDAGQMHLIRLKVFLSDCRAAHRNQKPGNSPQAKTGQEPVSWQDIHLLDRPGGFVQERVLRFPAIPVSRSEPDRPRAERTNFISPSPLADDHLPLG